MWNYRSRIGPLRIARRPDGYYLLVCLGYECGPYADPWAAADDVFTQTTGCARWDSYAELDDVPPDLSAWERQAGSG